MRIAILLTESTSFSRLLVFSKQPYASIGDRAVATVENCAGTHMETRIFDRRSTLASISSHLTVPSKMQVAFDSRSAPFESALFVYLCLVAAAFLLT